MSARVAIADTRGLFVVASAPAGWYDVDDVTRRWFDGRQWTDHYAPRLTLVPSIEPTRTRFRTDHGFHLIMSIMTFGCWTAVWATVGVANVVRTATSEQAR